MQTTPVVPLTLPFESLPEGSIGYLEFGAYPGYRFHELLRDAVEVHCGGLTDVDERRGQTMAILGFLANGAQSEAFRTFVRGELERIAEGGAELLDAEFDPARRGYQRGEIEATAGEAGLRCLLSDLNLEPGAYAFFYRGPGALAGEAPSPRADNGLYHEFAYPSYVHAQTHPDNLATMARIFGLDPVPINKCRVLELGCGTGHTLIAAGLDLAGSEFLGIDFSAPMIAEAATTAEAVGAKNVTFKAADILTLDAAALGGEFDYIVAHGMYSWVPPAVRERILTICRDHLSPRGIAYMSFNARPGYQLPAMLRDVAMAKGAPRTPADVDEAYERIRTLDPGGIPDAWRKLLDPCTEHFLSKSSSVQVMYDEMADVNNTFLFGEFAQAAASHGLRYVTEAKIDDWTANTIEARARQMLSDLVDDPVRRMQYRDCLRLTRFHASLLCRDTVQPTSIPIPDIACTMRVSSMAFPLSAEPDVKGPTKEGFESPGGVQVSIGEPLLKAALMILHTQRPRRFLLTKLAIDACKMLGVEDRAAEQRLRSWLMPFWETGFFDLYSHMPACATELNRKPWASEFAKYVAAQGALTVPSLLGCSASLSGEEDRALLLLLDGTRSHAKLAEETGIEPEEVVRRLEHFVRLGLIQTV